jgi:UDP-glucose 4-epimerase
VGVILVTGGAGYIGSHVVLELRARGLPVVVLDDLSAGRREVVPEGVELVAGDLGDAALLARLLDRHPIDAVIHLAASTKVGESVARPLAYYRNNVAASLGLLEACVAHGVKHFVLSSTAAVYGSPERMPVDEEAPCCPVSPYGHSKLMVERMLQDVGAAHGLGHVILRYFNVAGADPAGRAGQTTPEATHLIKVACEVVLGARPALALFGEDYPTPDGTCVRDYIHVSDLAQAHALALEHLRAGGASRTFNCGSGRGYSVREVIEAVSRVNGRKLAVERAPRRPGDAVAIVADTSRIERELGWRPERDLEQMVQDALAFERSWRSRAVA